MGLDDLDLKCEVLESEFCTSPFRIRRPPLVSNMRYTPNPRGFKTKHWRTLYESHIPDLITLKNSASGAAFVIVDAEPWGVDDSKPAEIGISLLPILDVDSINISQLLKTLDAASRSCSLETHWIRVVGRQRQEKNREIHRFGERHYVESDQVEQKVSDIIDLFQAKHCKDSLNRDKSRQVPLILAGFDLVFEFRVLSSLYPRLLNYFTSWLDLQELASDLAGGLKNPGLRETLIACGFGSDPSNLQSVGCQHNAATDSVRAAALLIQFLGFRAGEEKLKIGRSSRKTRTRFRNTSATPEEKRLWHGARPRPREFFPYTARISCTAGFSDFQVQTLFDLFVEYKPTAVGISNGKRYGWVCLPDKQTLQDFVQHINGTKTSEGDMWTVVSDYDPTVVPARDWEELKSNQRLEFLVNANERREQRRLRREAQNEEICNLSWLID